MEVFGSVGAGVALVLNLVSAIKACNEIRVRYHEAEDTMKKVTAVLETLQGALRQLSNLKTHDPDALASRWDTDGTIAGTFTIAIANFNTSIEALQKDLGSVLSKEGLSPTARIQYLWNESQMERHLTQLSAQIQALQFSLTILQTGSMSEVKKSLAVLEAAQKSPSSRNIHLSTHHEDFPESPSLLDEVDLIDLGGRYPEMALHTALLREAFVVESGSAEISLEKPSSATSTTDSTENGKVSETSPGNSTSSQEATVHTAIPATTQEDEEGKEGISGSRDSGKFVTNGLSVAESSPLPTTASNDVEIIPPSQEIVLEPGHQMNPSNAPISQPQSQAEITAIDKCNDTKTTVPRLMAGITKDEIHQLLHRPLHFAIETDNIALLLVLLDEGSDINLVDVVTKQTPLALAIVSKKQHAAYALLSHSSDFPTINGADEMESLLGAAVKCFLPTSSDRMDKDLSDIRIGALLRKAQERERYDILRCIISSSSSSGRIGNILDTEQILYWSVKGEDKDLTSFILRNGASTSKKFRAGDIWELPIHRACRHTNFDHVEALIAHGANILDQDSNDGLPFCQAAAGSNHGMVELVFKETVKAIKSELSSEEQAQGLECIIEMGLYYACANGNLQNLRLIMKIGAPEVGERKWDSLLHLSIQFGQMEIVKYLLEIGHSPNTRWEGKLPDEEPFEGGRGSISDYQACKDYVRQARAKMEADKSSNAKEKRLEQKVANQRPGLRTEKSITGASKAQQKVPDQSVRLRTGKSTVQASKAKKPAESPKASFNQFRRSLFTRKRSSINEYDLPSPTIPRNLTLGYGTSQPLSFRVANDIDTRDFPG